MDDFRNQARDPAQDQVYFRTRLGEQALAEPMRLLQYNLRRALALVDGRSSAAQVVTRFGDPVVGRAALADLLRAGLIGTDIPDGPSNAAAQPRVRAPAQGGLGPQGAQVGAGGQGIQGAGPAPIGAPPPGRSSGPSALRAAGLQAMRGKAAEPPKPRNSSPIIEEISLSAEDDLEEVSTSNLPVVVPQARPEDLAEKESRLKHWRESHSRVFQRLAVSWPLVLLIGGLGSLAVIVALVLFFPYASYKPEIEQRISAYLNVPVRVGNIRVTLTPRPNLTLDQVAVGRNGEVNVGSVKLIPYLMPVLKGGNLVFSVRMDGIEMNGRGLALLASARKQQGGQTVNFAVPYVEFTNLALVMNDWRLPRLRGNLAVGDLGLEGGNVRNEDDSLKLALSADGGKIRFTVSALDWRVGSQLVRNLDGEGEMDGQGLRFTRLEGGVVNGLVKGNLSVTWLPGFVSGDANLTRVDASQLAGLLGLNLPLRGELSGSFRASGPWNDWAAVGDPPMVEGDFRVLRGQLERFDFGMTVRNAGASWSRGGVTGFEELAVGVRREGALWRLSGFRLASGTMSAAGDALIGGDGALSGNVQVVLSDKVKSPVTLSGTLREPLMRALRSW